MALPQEADLTVAPVSQSIRCITAYFYRLFRKTPESCGLSGQVPLGADLGALPRSFFGIASFSRGQLAVFSESSA
jgi:hypothetical protein